MTGIFYYDDDARELRRWHEGTPLRDVNTLRSMAGVAFAFDGDGYVVGMVSDRGQFSPVPAEARGRRHISQYGRQIRVTRGRPEILGPGPPPDCRDTIRLPLFFGDDKFLDYIDVFVKNLGTSWYVYFGWKRNFRADSEFFGDIRKRIVLKIPFVLDEIGDLWSVPGRVYVRPDDLAPILFRFSKYVDIEIAG